jgi:hypothetical protein
MPLAIYVLSTTNLQFGHMMLAKCTWTSFDGNRGGVTFLLWYVLPNCLGPGIVAFIGNHAHFLVFCRLLGKDHGST